ncbi:hypothetical protein BH23DEI1_BH23DEI1_10690 [soil metagenome]|nr:hypothetical protein [Trueperaceae bacterium]
MNLASWRIRVLQSVLNTTAVAAAVAYIPGTLAAAGEGLVTLIAFNTLMWGVVVVLALAKGLSFEVRALAFASMWFVFTVALLWIVGPSGAGVAWLLALPVLSAVFFGRRGAIAGVGAVTVVGVVFAGVLLAPGVAWNPAVPGPGYDIASWSASAGSVIFLSVLLAVAVAHVLDGMSRSIVDLRSSNGRLEEALRSREALERELVRTAKARTLGALASGVAHDLNNLLVPMLAAGEGARDGAVAGSRQRAQLDLVLAAAERAQGLAGRILSFANDAPIERGALDVVPIVHEVIGLLDSGLSSRIRVRLELETDAAPVIAEPTELHQVVMNLCTNAARALQGTAGTISVRVARDRDRHEVVIEVRDDGPGITPEHLERVFEPYFTTRPVGEGTGLGLAIVRHVVEGLDGTITLASTAGAGATATVRLPDVSASAGVRVRV